MWRKYPRRSQCYCRIEQGVRAFDPPSCLLRYSFRTTVAAEVLAHEMWRNVDVA